LADCERLKDCGGYGDVPSPIDDCEVYADAMAAGCEAGLGAAVEAGTAVYDPQQGGACLATLRVQGCRAFRAQPRTRARCLRLAYVGQLGPGASCHDDVECVKGSICDVSAACPGTCEPEPGDALRTDLGPGSECGPGVGECAYDSACFGPGAATGTCRAFRDVGETCGPTLGECRPDHGWCEREGSAEDGVCASLPVAGEPCGEAAGLSPVCAGSICFAANGFCTTCRQAGDTCEPLGVVGAICELDIECATWNCQPNRSCGPILPPPDACPAPLTDPAE
jgi:hypothetical protein